MLERPPRCPEHEESFLNDQGECPECDYEAPDYSNEDPAAIFDSDWETQAQMSFKIYLSELCTTTPGDGHTPFIYVSSILPSGRCDVSIPMFWLRGMTNEHLVEVHRDGYRIVGIYSDDTYLIRELGADGEYIGQGNPWDGVSPPVRDQDELLWERTWEETTDPLCDIELS